MSWCCKSFWSQNEETKAWNSIASLWYPEKQKWKKQEEYFLNKMGDKSDNGTVSLLSKSCRNLLPFYSMRLLQRGNHGWGFWPIVMLNVWVARTADYSSSVRCSGLQIPQGLTKIFRKYKTLSEWFNDKHFGTKHLVTLLLQVKCHFQGLEWEKVHKSQSKNTLYKVTFSALNASWFLTWYRFDRQSIDGGKLTRIQA